MVNLEIEVKAKPGTTVIWRNRWLGVICGVHIHMHANIDVVYWAVIANRRCPTNVDPAEFEVIDAEYTPGADGIRIPLRNAGATPNSR